MATGILNERRIVTTNDEYDEAMLRLLRQVRGLRVQPTDEAIEQGIAKAGQRGTLVGWQNHRWSIRVRKDGQKTARGYNVIFWKPVR